MAAIARVECADDIGRPLPSTGRENGHQYAEPRCDAAIIDTTRSRSSIS